ncbi:MAG: hypothetical protein GTO14_16365 [Anaerolineales bacterium]|nr:hypothetical protein [Anaerolineales bacterium]
MSQSDFSHRRFFPGTDRSSLWFFLLLSDWIETLPGLIFAAILFTLALLPTHNQWLLTIGLWFFFLADWVLLSALPRVGKSYGPAKSPTLLLALLRLPTAFLPLPWNLATQVIGTLLVLYSFWIEPHAVQLTRQTLRSKKLKFGPPLRILHLGDLHLERMTAREKKILNLIPSLSPDLILFSGDFLNLSYIFDPAAWADVQEFLQQLSAPLGVFAVTGSPPIDHEGIIADILDETSVHWLRDEKVTLEHDSNRFDLIGISCTHKPFIDGPRLSSVLDEGNERFTVLLYHTPDLAPEASTAGIDLQLSGHTHGGQVRLPFWGAIVTSSLYGKRFESGRYDLGDLTLYVTRGIGMEGKGAPRVRFLCPPEITLWEISADSHLKDSSGIQ